MANFLGAEEWADVTDEQSLMPALRKSLNQLMGGKLCEQLSPMLSNGRARVWEASQEKGVMNLISQLENPCLGIIISNDTPGLWSSTWSIFNPEDAIETPDNNGAIFMVLNKTRAVSHFTGVHDVGLLGEKFANLAPIYQLVGEEEEEAERTPEEAEVGGATATGRGARGVVNSDDESSDTESEGGFDSDEEDYPDADEEYERVKNKEKGSSHAPDKVGVQYILITCVPSLKEEQIKAAMTATEWFTIRTFYNRSRLVGASSRFRIVHFKDTETIKVVTTTAQELVSLLWAEKVPGVTKIMSAAVATFEWVGLFVEESCEVITYREAEEEWQIPGREEPTFNDYVVGVACTLLGTCYTQKKNIARQMKTRINALKAYCGKAKIDQKLITAFVQNPDYEPGANLGIVSELIGKITCLVSASETNCNARSTDLLSIPAIRETYELDHFTEGLLVQFRLVAQKVHSTTLRFAVASIRDYELISKDPSSKMSAQAKTLQRIGKQIDDRPYTGCCHPLPIKFQIAQYPHMCYYGVKVYEKSLTEEEKTLFEDYKITSIESKLKPREMAYIQILVDNTPPMDDAALVGWLNRLDLATALEEFNNRSDSKQAALLKVMKGMDPVPKLYAHIKSLENAKARSQTNQALRAFLTDSTNQLVAQLWTFNKQTDLRYNQDVADAVKQINSATDEFVRTNLKDKTEIDAHLTPEQMWHENDYIENMLAKIKDLISTAQSVSDGVHPE